MQKDKKRTKGHSLIPAKKTLVDGVRFDSDSEAQYYRQRKDALKAIGYSMYHHPKVLIFPDITWELDFYLHNSETDHMIFVDVKGMKTAREAKLKIKIWRQIGPGDLQIIRMDHVSKEFLPEELIIPAQQILQGFYPEIISKGVELN